MQYTLLSVLQLHPMNCRGGVSSCPYMIGCFMVFSKFQQYISQLSKIFQLSLYLLRKNYHIINKVKHTNKPIIMPMFLKYITNTNRQTYTYRIHGKLNNIVLSLQYSKLFGKHQQPFVFEHIQLNHKVEQFLFSHFLSDNCGNL